MTISDTLSDATAEIRDYIADGRLECYGDLAWEILCTVTMMETLCAKLDTPPTHRGTAGANDSRVIHLPTGGKPK